LPLCGPGVVPVGERNAARLVVGELVRGRHQRFEICLFIGQGCGPENPVVFLVTQHTLVADVIEALPLVWAASAADEWKNRILEIPES
jgi:hypothetical protein